MLQKQNKHEPKAKEIGKKNSLRFQPKFNLISILMTAALMMSPLASGLVNAKSDEGNAENLEKEFASEEKARQMTELFKLGDELFERKDYSRAADAYEQIFVLDPENTKASAKIDSVKKQMLKEGKDETSVVNKVYEGEIRERIKTYWQQAKAFLEEKKTGQARFTIQKILLLDPLNNEAQKLYDQLGQEPISQKE